MHVKSQMVRKLFQNNTTSNFSCISIMHYRNVLNNIKHFKSDLAINKERHLDNLIYN